MIRNGSRLESQVDETQVIVVKASEGLAELRCGGSPMVDLGVASGAAMALDPAFSDGTIMGKRYVDDSGAEVLVTKAGRGSLSIGTTVLKIKEAAPLPASD